MTRLIQIYNPVHRQRVQAKTLNIMGRVPGKQFPSINVLVNKALIRKIRLGAAGTFECRVDLSKMTPGEHEVEIRGFAGHRTERVMVGFTLLADPAAEPEEAPTDPKGEEP